MGVIRPGGPQTPSYKGFDKHKGLRFARKRADYYAVGEALKGARRGQFSIRINDQWRICFEWPNGSLGPQNVEIVDCESTGIALEP